MTVGLVPPTFSPTTYIPTSLPSLKVEWGTWSFACGAKAGSSVGARESACTSSFDPIRRFATVFMDEARLAGLVRHPNAVGVLDIWEDEDGPFLMMDFVEGVPLSRLIARPPRWGGQSQCRSRFGSVQMRREACTRRTRAGRRTVYFGDPFIVATTTAILVAGAQRDGGPFSGNVPPGSLRSSAEISLTERFVRVIESRPPKPGATYPWRFRRRSDSRCSGPSKPRHARAARTYVPNQPQST